jgi:hypothetical protein
MASKTPHDWYGYILWQLSTLLVKYFSQTTVLLVSRIDCQDQILLTMTFPPISVSQQSWRTPSHNTSHTMQPQGFQQEFFDERINACA